MIKLLERFRTYKVGIEGKSESSIDQYIYRVKEFLTFHNIETDEALLSITRDMVKNWLLDLEKKGNSQSTRNAKLTAIQEIYRFFKEQEKLNIDIDILLLKKAKVPKKEMRFLNQEEAYIYMDGIVNQRTKAAVAINLATGIRFCELITLTVDDIKNGQTIINGKGNKERHIYFPPWCAKMVNKFIDGKRQHIIERTGVKTNLLFISDNGNIMTRGNYANSLKHYARKGEVEWAEIMSPHKLRHSAASIWYKKGFEVKEIQNGLGHSNMATTDRYVHTTEQQVKDMMASDDAFI